MQSANSADQKDSANSKEQKAFLKCKELESQLQAQGYEYELINFLGEGSYGLVARFTRVIRDAHQVRKEVVAVKYISDFFDTVVTAKRYMREMFLLCMLKHPYISTLLDVIEISDDEICLVLKNRDDNLEKALENVIKEGKLLTDQHIAFFAYHILSGLKYLGGANVMHRDLKLDNILMDANCDVEICDFGLGKKQTGSFEKEAAQEVEAYFRWRGK